MQLDQKNVLLGICGGIAAYKTPDLVRKLKALGANVKIVATDSALSFVSDLSLQAVSGSKVHHSLLDVEAEAAMGHIELARWADVLIIAPATANTIAKLANGFADDLLTTLCLATKAPVLFAPAMNQQMWAAHITAKNVNTLLSLGFVQLGPDSGEQACGDLGAGRMMEPLDIAKCVADYLSAPLTEKNTAISDTYVHQVDNPEVTNAKLPFKNKHFVITAGPTREALDPVRYITNHSSGKMGYAIAQAALDMGASVTLVTGPVNIKAPTEARAIKVNSADEMLDAVMQNMNSCDVFIACAAVADFKLKEIPTNKVKKKGNELTLTFIQNPDILKEVASLPTPPFTLGFAAETQNVVEYAQDKLKRKNINMIAANDVSKQDLGFNSDLNALTVISKTNQTELPAMDKVTLAKQLLALVKLELK